MKTILILLFTLLSIHTFAQREILNEISKDHLKIKGTKISLIPPKDFMTSENFNGLQNEESGSSIMVLDMPASFEQSAGGFTVENLAAQGIIIDTIEKIKINGMSALFIKGKQSAYGHEYHKIVLIFGSKEETIIINGAAPVIADQSTIEITKSMLSVVYSKNTTLDPFENLGFQFKYKNSPFVFAKALSGMIILNRDGQVPSLAKDKSALFIGKAHSNLSIPDKEAYCIERIKNLPTNAIKKIESIKEIKLNDAEGYEIIAISENTTTKETEKVYQVLLFSDVPYYFFIGTTNKNFEKNIAAFRKITTTFEIKN